MIEYRSKELYADFYKHEGKPLLALIGGSREGIWSRISPDFLEYLQDHYNLLIFAYFGVDGLPKKLCKIPLEYFINGITFIQNTMGINDENTIILGNSKGAEAALLISKYVKAHAIIACVPSCYVWQGLQRGIMDVIRPKSSWTMNGKELAYIRMKFDRNVMKDIKNKVYRTCYEKSIQENRTKHVEINIEDYAGKLFLLSSDIDSFWPSKEMSDILATRKKKDVIHKVLHVSGHYFQDVQEAIEETKHFLESLDEKVT